MVDYDPKYDADNDGVLNEWERMWLPQNDTTVYKDGKTLLPKEFDKYPIPNAEDDRSWLVNSWFNNPLMTGYSFFWDMFVDAITWGGRHKER